MPDFVTSPFLLVTLELDVVLLDELTEEDASFDLSIFALLFRAEPFSATPEMPLLDIFELL